MKHVWYKPVKQSDERPHCPHCSGVVDEMAEDRQSGNERHLSKRPPPCTSRKERDKCTNLIL